MFGTFQREEEEVIYGVTKPLASWNPVWANFDYYADLWIALKQPMRWSERFRLIMAYPGWMPERLGGLQRPKEVQPGDKVYDTSVPAGLNYYILFQFILVLLITTFFLFGLLGSTLSSRILLSAWVILSVMGLGGLFELKRWAQYIEFFRLSGLAVLVGAIDQTIWPGFPILVITVVLISGGWFMRFRRFFRASIAQTQEQLVA
jgi:hypothetical protein